MQRTTRVMGVMRRRWRAARPELCAPELTVLWPSHHAGVTAPVYA